MTAVARAKSPTTELWDGYQSAAQKRARMINMGLHVFYPEWQGSGRQFSHSFKNATLRIYGSDEQISFPIQTCTKVEDVKQAIAGAVMCHVDELKFLVKQGCSTRTLLNTDEMRSVVTVRGISSFRPARHRWPHPTAVIGSGYHGLKTLMMYLKSGNSDVVCFDRNDRVGGYCWITAANRFSKLQTEFGAFHVWWGQDSMQGSCGYPDEYWETWPRKEKVLEHFQHAAEEYGVLPHVRFRCNVEALDVVGERKSEDRHYALTVAKLDGGVKETVNCSVLWNYPGSMTKNRIVDYPGEDQFDGNIGYGMNDDAPYESFMGNNIAILGNGAFAVENARTCIEHGCNKVFIVTRRKNLASPRLPCWFVHQGPAPTPGRLVLKMFEPMYKMCDFGDPWKFWSVNASADKMKVQIIQNSRFGIGDVTFLAVACGKLEYVVDTLKRCSKHTLHLTSGRRLENVRVVLKALGLLGDFSVDRFHNMTSVHGFYCDGDWRRIIYLDATGMNAANFTTFSTGIGTTGYVRLNKFLFDHPKEFYRMQQFGIMSQLPINKAKNDEDKPAYVYDVVHTNSTMVIMHGMCPRAAELGSTDPAYKHKMYHISHPLDKFIDECVRSWDEYQESWRKAGCTAEYIPYPYTKEMVRGYFDEYNKATGMSIDPRGPADLSKEDFQQEAPSFAQLPAWAADDRNIEMAEQASKAEGAKWWYDISSSNVLKPGEIAPQKAKHH